MNSESTDQNNTVTTENNNEGTRIICIKMNKETMDDYLNRKILHKISLKKYNYDSKLLYKESMKRFTEPIYSFPGKKVTEEERKYIDTMLLAREKDVSNN
jgi:hypothetical protein